VLTCNARLDGPDQSWATPGRAQNALEQVRRGRLAVGAGNADHVEFGGRHTVETRRCERQRLTDVADDHLRQVDPTGRVQTSTAAPRDAAS